MSNQTNAKEKAAAKAPARMSKKDPLTKSQLELINAWWRAANYLAACQLYLLDNPLLREPLKPERPEAAPSWATGAPARARTSSTPT